MCFASHLAFPMFRTQNGDEWLLSFLFILQKIPLKPASMERKNSFEGMSSEEEVIVEVIPTLKAIVEDLSGLHGRAKKVLAVAQRTRSHEMVGLLRTLQEQAGQGGRVPAED
jgi:hypothetical protein